LAARTGGRFACGLTILSTNAVRNANGQVLANDVAARDVQAVTSPANRIATAKQSLGALRAAALGGRGQAAAAKS